MNPAEYVRAVRRRWTDVVLSIAVALVAGWFVASLVPPGPLVTSYEATSLIVITGSDTLNPGTQNLATLAALATTGEVPRRVAAAMTPPGDPAEIGLEVRATADTRAGVLRITATSDSARPVQVANLFARELMSFLDDRQSQSAIQTAEALSTKLDELQVEISSLERQVSQAPPDQATILGAQRDAKVRQYGLLYEGYQQIALRAASGSSGLQIINAHSAVPILPGAIQAPRSRTSRLILAGFLGLVFGVIIVLFLERFDTKIRTRQDAERYFEHRVLAEIPQVARRRKKLELGPMTRSSQKSYSPDAFRLLAATLTQWRGPGTAPSGNGEGFTLPSGNGARKRGSPRTILVTSPGPADGKTTIVANLARAFAGSGQRVIVLSCDFRRPRIHRLLGVENEIGLTDALQQAGHWPVLGGLVQATTVPGLSVVTSGGPAERPGDLVASQRMRQALAEARRRADVVLIDTPPILSSSDAAGLISDVEAVVLVARAGRTSGDVAERTRDLLKGLAAPVVGVVLNAATETSVPRRYYRYSYPKQTTEGRRNGASLAPSPDAFGAVEGPLGAQPRRELE